MDSHDLTSEQVDELLKHVLPMVEWLDRLQQRMRQQSFPADDPLLVQVSGALVGLNKLNVELHQLHNQRFTPKERG